MNAFNQAVQRHIERPMKPVPRKYLEPILYLAERMSAQDRLVPSPSQRMVDQLAEAARVNDVRRQPWFREMSEDQACEQLDLATVKRGALVVLSLVFKADTNHGDTARAYFSRLRARLGMDPIAVPTELEAHRDLALRYLVR